MSDAAFQLKAAGHLGVPLQTIYRLLTPADVDRSGQIFTKSCRDEENRGSWKNASIGGIGKVLINSASLPQLGGGAAGPQPGAGDGFDAAADDGPLLPWVVPG